MKFRGHNGFLSEEEHNNYIEAARNVDDLVDILHPDLKSSDS